MTSLLYPWMFIHFHTGHPLVPSQLLWLVRWDDSGEPFFFFPGTTFSRMHAHRTPARAKARAQADRIILALPSMLMMITHKGSQPSQKGVFPLFSAGNCFHFMLLLLSLPFLPCAFSDGFVVGWLHSGFQYPTHPRPKPKQTRPADAESCE